MTKASQRRTVANHRPRLMEHDLRRYEVRGLETDKTLVRGLAKRLAAGDEAAARLRRELAEKVPLAPRHRGGILAALRRSPLVGAGLRIRRETSRGRDSGL